MSFAPRPKLDPSNEARDRSKVRAASIDEAYSSINLQLRYRPARYRGRTL
jgi:hypothetical protein